MTRAPSDYRLADIVCHDLTDRPRAYRAGLSLRQREDSGFCCATCGELVTLAGNAIHDVRLLSRARGGSHA